MTGPPEASTPSNEPFLRWAQVAAASLASSLIALGIFVLIGWIADVPTLKSLSPNLVTMKANVAIAFCLAGAALLLFSRPGRASHGAAFAACIVVLLLGASTLGEHAFDWRLGIDELLFEEELVPGTENALQTDAPGRMAASSALSLILAGVALVGRRSRRIRATLVQVPGVAVLSLGFLSLLSYFYGVSSFQGIVNYNPMAAHTAAGFVLLGTAVLLSEPELGFMRVISADAFGGLMARRLLPAVLLAPPLIGVLRLIGERTDLYPSAFGTALFVVVMMAILMVVVAIISVRLNRLDVERQAAERSLERRNEEQRAFVAAASHELRTPLTSVMGYLEILEDPDTGPLTPSQHEVLGVIRRNARRLYGLVDSLMVLFRSESRSDLAISELDLAEIARESVESARPSATSKAVELTEESETSVPIRAQEQYVAQAVDNLLSNAIKFTPAGGRVTVSVFSKDGRAHCRVTDTGIGISAVDKEHLFDKFFRTASASTFGGTGLGLSIAQAIAEAHGGAIRVESTEGLGSTFDLVLPARGSAS